MEDYIPKYKELAPDPYNFYGKGWNTHGDGICVYYRNLKKQTPQDKNEIKRVEEYMKEYIGLDDAEVACQKIERMFLDFAMGDYSSISDCL